MREEVNFMSDCNTNCANDSTKMPQILGVATPVAVIGEFYTCPLRTILWDFLKEKLNRAKHERRN